MNLLAINTERLLLSLFCLSLTEPWIGGILLLLYRPYDIQHIECYINIESKIIFWFVLLTAGLLWLQGGQKTDDKNTNESKGVQKTENAPEQSEQMEQMEETQPSSEQAQS